MAGLKQNAGSSSPSCSGEQDGVGHTRADGYTRDIVADALGVSGATYQRAKHVVTVANASGPAP